MVVGADNDPHSLAARHAWYRSLQSDRPVEVDGVWVLARYGDVVAAAGDSGRYSSWFGNDRRHVHVEALPSLDPPEHTCVRRNLRAPFSPRSSYGAQSMVDDVVAANLDRVVSPRHGFDGIRSFASQVPVAVLAELLGMKRHVVAAAVERGGSLRWSIVGREVRAWLDGDSTSLPAVPRHLATAVHAGALSESSVRSFVVLLMIAGIDTVRDLLGELLLLIATQPMLLEEVRVRHGHADAVTEEVLRWVSPIQAVYRTTTSTCVVEGTVIPSGAKVMLLVGAANCDQAVWSSAAELDLDRYVAGRAHGRTEDARATDHLAFGAGPHRCLGATLARMQIAAVVRSLPASIGALELVGAPVQRTSRMAQGLQALPLRASPR